MLKAIYKGSINNRKNSKYFPHNFPKKELNVEKIFHVIKFLIEIFVKKSKIKEIDFDKQ